jgi:phospholipid/cholesterol/gamma-HCH transport system ATP-binding protein
MSSENSTGEILKVVERKEIESIEFKDLCFGYAGEKLIFNLAQFKFPMQSFVSIESDSGTGRTSLLEILCALSNPNSGQYLINGQDVASMSFEEFLPYRLNIGFGFDFGGLIQNRSILDNIALPLIYHRLLSVEEAHDRARTYMNFMGIDRHAKKRPPMVPGGVRKIACLIRALIFHPQMVLLDDPTVGLEPAISEGYFHLLSDLYNKGIVKHIFFSSYDEDLLSRLKPAVISISDGQLFDKSSSELPRVVGL